VSTITKMWVYCGPNHLDSTVQAGGAIQFSSVFQIGSGSPGQQIDWVIDSGSLGSVSPSRGLTTTYTAPMTPGTYKVWGTSVWDPAKKHSCWITVTSDFFLTRGAMATARQGHTATLLRDGRVLVVGGGNNSSGALSTAEIYDPKNGIFTPTGSMAFARGGHRATLLHDGTVLVVGGSYSTTSAEIFDPASGTFATIAGPIGGPVDPTMTLLADGRVLVAGGGINIDNLNTDRAWVYDPALGSFSATGPMTNRREGHTATLLSGGGVLVAGGWANDDLGSNRGILPTAEGWWPGTGTFEATRNYLRTGRAGHTATSLADGSVFLAGGIGMTGVLALTETFRGTNLDGLFWVTGEMTTPRSSHSATALADGRVLLVGGNADQVTLASAEIFTPSPYDPGTFVRTVGDLNTPRFSHTATLLGNGTVLIVGGNDGTSVLATAELYAP
jgi:hypothetical protein